MVTFIHIRFSQDGRMQKKISLRKIAINIHREPLPHRARETQINWIYLASRFNLILRKYSTQTIDQYLTICIPHNIKK